jgi:protein-S-isoprenylcysteine O-methyltransferase Ste14
VSLTVTIAMVVFANKALKLGGPWGMVRTIVVLALAGIGLLIWVVKALFGANVADTPNEEMIKQTIKKTSAWLNDLKSEWDSAKRK